MCACARCCMRVCVWVFDMYICGRDYVWVRYCMYVCVLFAVVFVFVCVCVCVRVEVCSS